MANSLHTSESQVCYHIEGFLNCAYFHSAVQIADKVVDHQAKVNVRAYKREEWRNRVQEIWKNIPEAQQQRHSTSPIIYEGCAPSESSYSWIKRLWSQGTTRSYNFIGGYTEFAKLAKEKHGVEP
ncbi:uncharacterized protein VTP21DRAFT_4559 [Calcarisporiella thermophila]|uniref:uncharacterized protein n=1 Tax=Calcarisporiella thermophila TaxID=911321 RepID=UPI003743C2D6